MCITSMYDKIINMITCILICKRVRALYEQININM